jgi:probable HAF family extracellular repeat protein
MLRLWMLSTFTLAINGFLHAACAQSASYDFRVLKSPARVSETLIARNSAGAKLFERESARGALTCVLVKGGSRLIISDPKGSFTRCTGLGSNGGVVGWYDTGNGLPPYTGFAYLDGAYADVVPGTANPAWGSTVNAVSPNGLMAGMYLAPDGSYPIFVTYGSSYNTVQLGGVQTLIATGVNDSGVLVAQELFATMWGDEISSVLIVDGIASSIVFPGSVTTYANNINNNGDVVGYYADSEEVQHGFIYSSTKNAYFGPIDVPGGADTTLTGITTEDVVTGSAVFPGAMTSQAIIGFPATPAAALGK